MEGVIRVHPVVLLNVIDHVTRAELHHCGEKKNVSKEVEEVEELRAVGRSTKPSYLSPSATPMFYPVVGLLLGTRDPITPSDTPFAGDKALGGGVAVTLRDSFELPLRPPDAPHQAATVPGTRIPYRVDGACLQRLLVHDIDWPAAREHRDRLCAVVPELSVVGCYAVSASERVAVAHRQACMVGGGGGADVKRTSPRDNSPAGITSKQLKGEGQAAEEDTIVAIARCVTRQLSESNLLPSTAEGAGLMVVYDGELAEMATASPSPFRIATTARLPFESFWVATKAVEAFATTTMSVAPTDMEWISLATEALPLVERGDDASPPPRSAVSPRTPPLHVFAGENLLGSLRLLSRFLDSIQGDASSDESTASLRSPSTVAADAQLLRRVATCLRNVPVGNVAATCPLDGPSSTRPTPSNEAPALAEEIVGACLALELQSATHLTTLQQQQQGILNSRQSAMSLLDIEKAYEPPSTSRYRGDREVRESTRWHAKFSEPVKPQRIILRGHP